MALSAIESILFWREAIGELLAIFSSSFHCRIRRNILVHGFVTSFVT